MDADFVSFIGVTVLLLAIMRQWSVLLHDFKEVVSYIGNSDLNVIAKSFSVVGAILFMGLTTLSTIYCVVGYVGTFMVY